MALATVEGMNTPFSYPGRRLLQCWACAQFFPCVHRDARFCGGACKEWARRRQKSRQPWHFLRVVGNELVVTTTNDNDTTRAIWYDNARARTYTHVLGHEGTLSSSLIIEYTTHQQFPSPSVPLLCYEAGDGVAAPQQESGIVGGND